MSIELKVLYTDRNRNRLMDRFEPGTLLLDRYEIVRRLGRGGMGVVYLANDIRLEQRVALKIILKHYQNNSKAVARFVREVNTIRQLNHPYIVKILGARHDKDLLFYTMEYIKGRTLRDYIVKKKRLKFGGVVRVLCMVADALDHVHTITIHRDISPENIMVLKDGTIRLLDFGLAKMDNPEQALTQVGISLGKLLYSAPEQRRSAADVDLRTDIYPMGVMFYEMLTGQLPKGEVTIAELCPSAPPGCDVFYRKATDSLPEKRFQTAAEFRDTLLALYQISQEAAKEADSEETLYGSTSETIDSDAAADFLQGEETPPPPEPKRRRSWLGRLIARLLGKR